MNCYSYNNFFLSIFLYYTIYYLSHFFSLNCKICLFTNNINSFQTLLGLGARTFWIHNTGPIGCLPVAMPVHNAMNTTPGAGYLDQNGCINYQNDMAREFNKKLKNTVVKLRVQFPDASLIYVDMFSAKYELISNANKEGNPLTSSEVNLYQWFQISISSADFKLILSFILLRSHPRNSIKIDSKD